MEGGDENVTLLLGVVAAEGVAGLVGKHWGVTRVMRCGGSRGAGSNVFE